ncbi:hypothetical protein T03_13009 [Trichinella britovi]|uniref:Uncharacterized protein n=2 Tax=Trichinella TaxID=6333 RepID=A0A0V1D2M1_TRIBR|nr:hypothetical protein T05_4611 [Trichinella murrelli]KRX55940.1 hypothetical protein T09_7003 [Trichinella sp. T9]KRY55752.1 hypothetical protein T03_13009 [Trichinella britovi]
MDILTRNKIVQFFYSNKTGMSSSVVKLRSALAQAMEKVAKFCRRQNATGVDLISLTNSAYFFTHLNPPIKWIVPDVSCSLRQFGVKRSLLFEP